MRFPPFYCLHLHSSDQNTWRKDPEGKVTCFGSQSWRFQPIVLVSVDPGYRMRQMPCWQEHVEEEAICLMAKRKQRDTQREYICIGWAFSFFWLFCIACETLLLLSSASPPLECCHRPSEVCLISQNFLHPKELPFNVSPQRCSVSLATIRAKVLCIKFGHLWKAHICDPFDQRPNSVLCGINRRHLAYNLTDTSFLQYPVHLQVGYSFLCLQVQSNHGFVCYRDKRLFQ